MAQVALAEASSSSLMAATSPASMSPWLTASSLIIMRVRAVLCSVAVLACWVLRRCDVRRFCTAVTGDGGGLHVDLETIDDTPVTNITVVNCTFAGNVASA